MKDVKQITCNVGDTIIAKFEIAHKTNSGDK